MAKLEADVVRPFNPPFYDRYVDDCFSKKKKGEPDALVERLNRYHPKTNKLFLMYPNFSQRELHKIYMHACGRSF